MPTVAPHLLYVAWGYPPARGSGVYRALATPNAFAARGWRVTVVTADRESFAKYTGADPSLEALIDPRVRVVRVPFRRPYLEDDVGSWSLFRSSTWQALRPCTIRAFPSSLTTAMRGSSTRSPARVSRAPGAGSIESSANCSPAPPRCGS